MGSRLPQFAFPDCPKTSKKEEIKIIPPSKSLIKVNDQSHEDVFC